MPLGLSVALVVLSGVVLLGVVGYLIDRSEERLERDSQTDAANRAHDVRNAHLP